MTLTQFINIITNNICLNIMYVSTIYPVHFFLILQNTSRFLVAWNIIVRGVDDTCALDDEVVFVMDWQTLRLTTHLGDAQLAGKRRRQCVYMETNARADVCICVWATLVTGARICYFVSFLQFDNHCAWPKRKYRCPLFQMIAVEHEGHYSILQNQKLCSPNAFQFQYIVLNLNVVGFETSLHSDKQ